MMRSNKTVGHHLLGPRRIVFKFFADVSSGTNSGCKQKALVGALSNVYSSQQRPFSSSSSSSWSPLQRDLLQRALQHVPEHGWTQDAIAAAAAASSKSSLNQSIAVAGLITVQDLIFYCMQDWNERLQQELHSSDDWKQQQQQQQLEDKTDSVLSSIPLSPRTHRIAQAFQIRLQYEQDLLPVWHQAMALGARPDQVWKTQEQLKEMVDIVVAATTTATTTTTANTTTTTIDNNRDNVPLSIPARLSLGAVYVATELHMLSDSSPNWQDTWVFLRQQLQHWEHMYGDNSSSSVRTLEDAAWVTSTVATAMASGVASLLMPSLPSLMSSSNNSSSSSSSTITAAWNTVSQQMPFASGAATDQHSNDSSFSSINNTNDGTDPKHYDTPADEPPKRKT